MRIVNANQLASGLKIAASTDRPDMEEVDKFRQKIDAAFFKSAELPSDGRPHWADQLVSVEFKRHETNMDPFDDRDGSTVDAQAVERKKVRGQIITYAEQIFRLQHRTALYMLLVIGRNFRFVRWDRSGAIVTRAVDYVAQPDVLCDFLWRLGMQSDEQLGIDPSATRLYPGDEDYKLMDECAVELATDLTADERIVTGEEMKADPPVFKYVRLSFRQALQADWPRYRLEVPHGEKTRSFLVGKPMFHARGMAGRGTRGYVALDLDTKRFVWLKDAWRVHYELVDQEGTVLSLLNKGGVDFVPTLVCHGDIRDQTTVTPEVWEEQHPSKSEQNPPGSSSPANKSSLPSSSSSATLAEPQSSSTSRKRSRSESDSEATRVGSDREECPLRRHMHYRIVVEEVAIPLSDGARLPVRCAFVFVSAHIVTLIGFIAHWDAVTKAQILHRDVSGGNILILPKLVYEPTTDQIELKWTGLLADWEMSKPMHDKEELRRPRQPPRTVCASSSMSGYCAHALFKGTWQFLSVGMLSKKPKVPDIPDELESFLYVTLYYAVRYLKSNCTNAGAYLEAFFDAYTVTPEGIYTCGAAKSNALETHGRLYLMRNVELKLDSPLDTIFRKLLLCFKAHYKIQSYRDRQTKPDDSAEPSDTAQDDDQDFASPPSSPTTKPIRRTASRAHVLKAFAARKTLLLPPPDAPTREDENNASLIAEHSWMVGILAEALDSKEWQADKVGDRVPPEYKPQYDVAKLDGPASSTMKRRKIAMAKSAIDVGTRYSGLPAPGFCSEPATAGAEATQN
ncbi:hypothetical protein BV20DRAFT_975682 [Pilatotrama ljubarskyi]|nr:hypothetical protein BV20DRAFT_975682 [Pilatotrama ljubarskyi]